MSPNNTGNINWKLEELSHLLSLKTPTDNYTFVCAQRLLGTDSILLAAETFCELSQYVCRRLEDIFYYYSLLCTDIVTNETPLPELFNLKADLPKVNIIVLHQNIITLIYL